MMGLLMMNTAQETAHWVGVDWGRSRLRVWMMTRDGVPFAEESSTKGTEQLTRDEFEPALLELIAPYLDRGRVTPVFCAGVAGTHQGWMNVRPITVPCSPPTQDHKVVVETKDPQISLHLLAGISQINPPDVMQGEETQIMGFLSKEPEFDGVLCVIGTHTKWVHISAGEIVSFQTFLTGELLRLLSTQSVLRHSMQGAGGDQAGFLAALSDAQARPQALAAQLFSLGAGALISDAPQYDAMARLSGLLIGVELAAARPYWLGQNVAIVGEGPLCDHYGLALAEQGVPTSFFDASDLTLAGLCVVSQLAAG